MNRLAPLVFVACLLACTAPPTPGTDAGVSDSGSALDAGPVDEVCATQHSEVDATGVTITVCDVAFADAPLVRLPADSSELVYGGVARDTTNELVFATRGATYPIMPGDPWLVPETGSGNARYAYFIYRAHVRGGVIESVDPVVRIDDRVFARLLAGVVFEGYASPRTVDAATGEVRFTFDSVTVPMRVRMEAAPDDTEIDHELTGFPRYPIVGHVENFDSAVTAADGSCLPAISSLGEASPLFGHTDDEYAIARNPNMHGGLDDVFTVYGNMGSGLFVSPPALMQPIAPAPTNGHSSPHGTPWGGPTFDLTAVIGGGGASCTP